MSVVSFRYIT